MKSASTLSTWPSTGRRATRAWTRKTSYEAPKQYVPSVAICAFTGRATQMVKKNFPRDWHGNIMTIHRLLGFYPEFYDDWDEELGRYRKKVRFVPTYDADFKLPWDVILIDEAGMQGVDLWHQLWAACKPGCRIYMIGDINQLPPVHGRSVFGFAMAKWPSWELTHIHRQQGKDNPIVDNAWRILHGRMPVSDGRFQMVELKGDANYSSRQIRAMMPAMKNRGVYDPIRDAIITPINGEDGSRGYALGQLPLNREFALIFNPKTPENPRYIIDGGRERKQFAVGDKVMATRNDWESGITNGMTGVITDIVENGGYSGDRNHFGTVEEVNRYMSEDDYERDGDPFDLDPDSLLESFDAIEKGIKDKREKRDRGPSSHIVTVRFGADDNVIEVPFASLSEVGSLMTAYVVTCHKMQGGEAPVIVIICHDAHKSMLYREWLYTAITRASHMCILLYTTGALKAALNKQKIKGSTLQEKVRCFNAWQDDSGTLGAAVNVILPESESTGNRVLERKALAVVTPRELTTPDELKGGLASLINKQRKEITEHAKQAEYKGAVKGVDSLIGKTFKVKIVHEHIVRVE
jgi:ATP-dependent exoDNAse (exonuclease V) alpha subunit